MQSLVSRLINLNEDPIKERDSRLLIIALHKQRETENTFYRHLAMQEYKTMTIVALKVLTITNKLGLYFSNMSHKSLVSLYQKISTTWKLILTNKVKHSADTFRCEYFANLIIQYSEFLQMKSQLIIDYADFLDGGYSLNNFFKSSVTMSPLQLQFLQKVNKLWNMVNQIGTKIIQSPKYLWNIRLNIAVILIEENYLLLSLLTHLILTFKIVCQKFNKEVPENVKEFISKFERNYETNLKGFQSYLLAISQIS